MRHPFRQSLITASAFLLIPSLVLAQIPNDAQYSQQWYLNTIAAPSAWDITTGSSSVIVAVLDTGLDMEHEDIKANLWTNTKEIAGNGIDDDKNGYIDDIHGWDFIGSDGDPSPSPVLGSSRDAIDHGTLVAGEIAAVGNNSLGMAGIAWTAKIMPVRMLDDQGAGDEFDAANAIRYAVNNGAKVINMSFVGDEAHATLQAAVQDAYNKGVVIVSAMGNDTRDTNATPVYPACLRTTADDWVIGVTATDINDKGATFTNYGNICADVAAPGTNMYGLSYFNIADGFSDKYLGPWSGTSMAAPLVSGTAVLLFSKYPTLSAADVRNIIKLSVDPVNTTGYTSGALGAGRLNMNRALQLAASYVPATPATTTPATTSTTPTTTTNKIIPSNGTEDLLQYSFAIFGAPFGVLPTVDVRHANGNEYATFQAYTSNFKGGVHVATINNDHDSTPEIVTGAGESGGPHIRIFKAFGAVAHEFFAYDKASSHGVNIAVGDVNGDGEDDIVTSVGENVSQDVIVWDESGKEISRFPASFFPASSPLSVTTLNIDSDAAQEVAVTGLIDGVSHIAVYDNDGKYLVDFTPFAGINSLSVSSGDMDGDLIDDIFVSRTGTGNTVNAVTKIGALRRSIIIDGQASVGNIVAGVDLDLDGRDDIITSENTDAGLVSLIASDGKTSMGSWHAPSFGSKLSAFFTAW